MFFSKGNIFFAAFYKTELEAHLLWLLFCQLNPQTIYLEQVQVQLFVNGRPFISDRAFISTCSALPASIYKLPSVYKRATNIAG